MFKSQWIPSSAVRWICLSSDYCASKKKSAVTKYIQRQSTDEFARKAREHSFRARSAFKLLEINERFKIIKPGMCVLDVGAAPGSWSQVLKQLVKVGEDSNALVIGVDLQPVLPLEGVKFFDSSDIFADKTINQLNKYLNGRSVDVVVSDMAPNPSGDSGLDHERILSMCDRLLQLCVLQSSIALSKGTSGAFLCKIWDGPGRARFLNQLKQHFASVRCVKPKASRDHSAELYLLATRLL